MVFFNDPWKEFELFLCVLRRVGRLLLLDYRIRLLLLHALNSAIHLEHFFEKVSYLSLMGVGVCVVCDVIVLVAGCWFFNRGLWVYVVVMLTTGCSLGSHI
jgi:hypothetical protein